ncbi:MarR family protein [Micromonospora sp. MW-13]|uniref:MarR family winged helix-turn-helix transcriptional regulator n=1 Tax=unclassified Micromonospora TaxID=2617518 RepID=UPI000EBE84E5|nr:MULTISPECIES: MarR family transcriptional regulator [unclassified Micromonospora]MCX4471829.1 MarR family transcriptional regulator [Micromonospora sp. NBC_01655]RGC66891.1 MarR family protein [Micromonospora sp. MW-13]
METTARELGMRMYDLLKSIRMIKQRRADDRPAVPLGLVGMLVQLDQHPTGCHARELAVRTGLDPSTVSRAVASLVSHALVERRADPADRRATWLAVTSAGKAALADAHGWYGELLERALADWTPGEVAALCAALGRFTRDLEVALATNDNLEDAR